MASHSSQNTSKQEPAVDDLNSKKQWDTINDHLRQMHVWTESIPSPLSTSPANKNIVTRPHNNQHNPLYRRSEGDIKSSPFELQKSMKPPQSAPVVPEDFELSWQNQDPTSYINNYNKQDHSSSNHVEDNQVISSQSSFKSSSNYVNPTDGKAKEHPKKQELVGVDHVLGETSHKDSSYSHVRSPDIARYGSRIIHSSVSSPSLKVQNINPNQYSGDKVADYQNPSYSSNQMMSTAKYRNSPNFRRKSAPSTGSLYHGTPEIAISQSVQSMGMQKTSYPSLSIDKKMKLPFVEGIKESNAEVDLDNDREYTRALLQHQRDRMDRLNLEFESKKSELANLISHMNAMETKSLQCSSSNKPHTPPTLHFDVAKLRDINRQLKIDCNCMYKEVELFSSYGDSTSDNFYSRYDRQKAKPKNSAKPIRTDLPPPPSPPYRSNEESKWRCSHCTFDNHAALNNCEICDYPRAVES